MSLISKSARVLANHSLAGAFSLCDAGRRDIQCSHSPPARQACPLIFTHLTKNQSQFPLASFYLRQLLNPFQLQIPPLEPPKPTARCVLSPQDSAAKSGTHVELCWSAGRPSGLLPMKILSRCRDQARRVYYGAVFKIKKEIPAKRETPHYLCTREQFWSAGKKPKLLQGLHMLWATTVRNQRLR